MIKELVVVIKTPDWTVETTLNGDNLFKRAETLIQKNIKTCEKYGLEGSYSISVKN